MFNKSFWILASERALKTVAQTFLAMVTAVGVFDVLDSDWTTILGVSVGAGLLSYATSIVSSEVGNRNDPSIVFPKPEWSQEGFHELEDEENE
jgi:hypothetical protein